MRSNVRDPSTSDSRQTLYHFQVEEYSFMSWTHRSTVSVSATATATVSVSATASVAVVLSDQLQTTCRKRNHNRNYIGGRTITRLGQCHRGPFCVDNHSASSLYCQYVWYLVYWYRIEHLRFKAFSSTTTAIDDRVLDSRTVKRQRSVSYTLLQQRPMMSRHFHSHRPIFLYPLSTEDSLIRIHPKRRYLLPTRGKLPGIKEKRDHHRWKRSLPQVFVPTIDWDF